MKLKQQPSLAKPVPDQPFLILDSIREDFKAGYEAGQRYNSEDHSGDEKYQKEKELQKEKLKVKEKPFQAEEIPNDPELNQAIVEKPVCTTVKTTVNCNVKALIATKVQTEMKLALTLDKPLTVDIKELPAEKAVTEIKIATTTGTPVNSAVVATPVKVVTIEPVKEIPSTPSTKPNTILDKKVIEEKLVKDR